MEARRSLVVEILARLYHLLLYLYPQDHREEYGWLMAQVFRDKACDAWRRGGAVAVLMYWFATLWDLLVSALQEQTEQDLALSDALIVASHPYLLMAAGALLSFASVSQLQPDDHWSFYGIYALAMFGLPVALVMLISGLYGMRRWFRSQSGLPGRLALRVSILGGGFGVALMFLLPLHELIYSSMMLGFGMLFGGMAVMGLDLLVTGLPPRWVAILLMVSGLSPFVAFSLETVRYGARYMDFAGMLVAGISWLLIGSYLRLRARAGLAHQTR